MKYFQFVFFYFYFCLDFFLWMQKNPGSWIES